MSTYSQLTDEQLAEACKDADSLAWNELLSRYLPKIRYIAGLHSKIQSEQDDLISAGVNKGLVDAVICFDEGRGFRFVTFATNCITRNIIDEVNKRRSATRISPENCIDFKQEYEEIIYNPDAKLELRDVISGFDKVLTVFEKQAFVLSLQGYSADEIADRLSVTRKAAESAIYKARKKIKEHHAG